jgi:hypothetical protein
MVAHFVNHWMMRSSTNWTASSSSMMLHHHMMPLHFVVTMMMRYSETDYTCGYNNNYVTDVISIPITSVCQYARHMVSKVLNPRG